MFDFRYHVASLAAVFLALVIGILVGVGIADRGLVDKANTHLLEQEVSSLRTQLSNASKQKAVSAREQAAAQKYINETYPVLVRDRLKGKRVAVVFVGRVDGGLNSAIGDALRDSGATPVRLRALKMPIDDKQLDAKLSGQPADQEYVGKSKLEQLGRALGTELVTGGETPLWNTLSDSLVDQQAGSGKQRVDGVVVARTVPPQRNGTSRFLFGLYQGLSSGGVPAVGVEASDAPTSAVPIFKKVDLSSVDNIDTPAGRLSLVLLLAGAPNGQYGFKSTADDALPPFERG
ncbi:MAG TPA: copper transporter [Gaiellaceae bacterium]